MSDDPAPVQTPADAAPVAPQFEIQEVSQVHRSWRLTLYPGHLGLQPQEETQPYVYLRADFFEKVEFFAGLRLLTLRTPVKLSFKLSKEAALAFRRWFGIPNRQQLILLLQRRYALAIPVAMLFILASLPFGGSDPAAAAGKRLAFDPLSFGLGVGLAALWAGAKLRPHPVLFLLDGLWFLALAAGQLTLLCRDGHWWWALWTLLLFWMSVSGFQRYRQFRAS